MTYVSRIPLPGPRHGGIATTVWTCLAANIFQRSTYPLPPRPQPAGEQAGAGGEGEGGARTLPPLRNAREFLARLFGCIVDVDGHLYSHRVDIRQVIIPCVYCVYVCMCV